MSGLGTHRSPPWAQSVDSCGGLRRRLSGSARPNAPFYPAPGACPERVGVRTPAPPSTPTPWPSCSDLEFECPRPTTSISSASSDGGSREGNMAAASPARAAVFGSADRIRTAARGGVRKSVPRAGPGCFSPLPTGPDFADRAAPATEIRKPHCIAHSVMKNRASGQIERPSSAVCTCSK